MSVFESIPKNVVINHIVPHLTYKQRTKLYSTCRHFLSIKTNEYIYGDFMELSRGGIFEIFYMLGRIRIAVLSLYLYRVKNRYVLEVYNGYEELYDKIERETFGPGLPRDLYPDNPVYHIVERPITVSYETYMQYYRKRLKRK